MSEKKEEQMPSFMSRVINIGFFGGLCWGVVGYIAYYLNLAKIGPALALAPWALGKWKGEWLGQLLGIIVIALLSILIAILYRFLFIRIKNMFGGLLYGILLWLCVFYLLHPIFPGLEPVKNLGRNTIATTICIFILYGVFVGYSVSFEYHQRKLMRERKSS
ncbi:hypothetical protein A374_15362 [Fictibacillus macauensis ZFHKF-1]|uniref:YqhR n=2 Tax=Fictibacillus TaxID=1329200 RepID=I8IYH6_9BACL|nr:hypothetical protein A374_15362 [Fictibacillus macauensis ZFHKF-1]